MNRFASRVYWQWSDLKRPHLLFGSIILLIVSFIATFTISCNLHELTHLIVSRLMGLDILWIQWCVPGSGGEVRLAEIPPPLELYAGGIGSALVIFLGYAGLFVRLQLPHRSPLWYAVGLPWPAIAAAQFLIGILEGSSHGAYGGNYGAMIGDQPLLFIPLIIGVILAGGTAHVLFWRSVFQRI